MQEGCKVVGQEKARESHFMLSRVPKSVREWTFTLPSEFHVGSWSPKWPPESSECNFRGQNPSFWKFLYIIEKLLKLRCLKWVRIPHLDIWNTSYDQKKGRESNCQFDSWPLKIKNRPDFLVWKKCATYRCKALDKGYNFALDLIAIKGFHTKLWAPKVAKVLIVRISGLPLGDKKTFGCGPRGDLQRII
jgi:hypothetical protein